MSEQAQKCENNAAIFKQNCFMPTLFIALKMANSCCSSLGGNLDFLKKFYNINY